MNTNVRSLRDRCREAALRDHHHQVLEILEPVPLTEIHTDQDVSFWRALALLSNVQYARAKEAVDEFESRFVTANDPLAMGRLYMMRSHLHIMDGDSEASYELELKAAALFPLDAYLERLRCWATIDALAGHEGNDENIERAVEALSDARDNLPFDQSWWYSFVVPNRADILVKNGSLDEAEILLEAQLAATPATEIGIIKLRLAVIALEKLDLQRAGGLMAEIEDDVPNSYWNTETYLIRSHVHWHLGNNEKSIRILKDAMAKRAQSHSRAEHHRAQVQLCELWVQNGEIELAEAWIGLASRSIDQWPRSFGHPNPRLIMSELAMAKGEWQQAISLLHELQAEATRRKHRGILVSILAHLAYAYSQFGDSESALQMAKCAIAAGANGAFYRSYCVFGTDIRMLVSRSPKQFVQARATSPSRSVPLSDREIEVLTLAAQGKRNAEIANELFISVSTVKNHMAKIFRSVGASNRREAIATARQHGLIQ